MKNLLLILVGILFSFSLKAQTITQTVKGQILDKQSEIPIIGATIQWLDSENSIGSITDLDGYFRLENIPVGRQAFRISYLGYETITLPNVDITAGKEVVLNLTMTESTQVLDEIVITAEVAKDKAINEMAAISARTFSLEEVNRYAGGRSDVARLAGNFAGVATADDSRNDIVVRGNSPTGVLWRLEGVPIPNPNHFSTLGSTGGPVSALNPNVLKNSDFLTSAFPAEYGNASSSVFDLNMRSGNRDKHEFMAQMGAFSGIEAMAEGPLGKKGGAYLLAARNSFVAILSAPGTSATPYYNDITFKVDSPTGKFGKFSLFGIGGTSSIDFIGTDIDTTDLFSEPDQDLSSDSKFGVIGLRHNKIIGDDSYIRTVIAASYSGNTFEIDRYFNQGTSEEIKLRYIDGNNIERRLSISSFYNKKFNS
ncbi:MAG TPA: carboxypeptidase-like regulatory domain-containing protein, partial [Phaeodactylibacter sp.]|nr:carboxypeptidase-like regulatory domain-containing protein [Phaeodactylibacter sp.]